MSPKNVFLLSLLAAVVLWKMLRVDWIIECEAASADFHPPVSVERFTASYTPPVSPCWAPPTPESLTGRANATWADAEFFAAGGSYGPVSTPALKVNWRLTLAKAAGVFILAGWIGWIPFRRT